MSTVLYFAYVDSSNDDELWYYTGKKFVEVTPGLQPSEGGLYPRYLDAFGTKVIFQGTNAHGQQGLWVSNGKAKGTHEVTAIKGANRGGLFPSGFITYKTEVLFDGESGFEGAPLHSLWVTKGAASNTKQLGGANNHEIKGANQSIGLLAYFNGFTIFNNIAYFDGYDTAGNIGLWRTDGTVKGTFEIQPIKGAFTVGTPGTDIQPSYMCVVSKTKMFFGGADLQDGQAGLWVTNGTAKGTIEIGGQANKEVKNSPSGNPRNLPTGMGPIDITAYKGKAIFAATDNTTRPNGFYAHAEGLWISNGTVKGTIEIGDHGSSGVKGAASAQNGGFLGGVGNPDFTVYQNKVLFLGVDKTENPGQLSLWVTNGTVSGTQEIGGLGNAGIKDHPIFASDQKTPDFTVFDGKVLFTAMTDVNGLNQWGIWETNGTASGTKMIFSTGSNYEPVTNFIIGKA